MKSSPIVVDHTKSLNTVEELGICTTSLSNDEKSTDPLSCTIMSRIEPSVSIDFNSSTLKETKKKEQNDSFPANTVLCVSEKIPQYTERALITKKLNANSIVNSKNKSIRKNDLDLLTFSNDGCQVKLSQSAQSFNLVAHSFSADNSKTTKTSLCTSVICKPSISVISNNNSSKVSLLTNKADCFSVSSNLVKNKISFPNKCTETSVNVIKNLTTKVTTKSLCLNLPPLKATVVINPSSLSTSNFSEKHSEIDHSYNLKNYDGKGTTKAFLEQKKIVYGKLSVITAPNSEGVNKKKLVFLPSKSTEFNFSKELPLNLFSNSINPQTSQIVLKSLTVPQRTTIGTTATPQKSVIYKIPPVHQKSPICKTSSASQKLPIMVSNLSKNLSDLNVIERNKFSSQVTHSNNIKLSASRVSNSIERSLVNELKEGVATSDSNSNILQTFILNMPRSKFGLKFGVHCLPPTTVITTTFLNSAKVPVSNEKSNISNLTVSHSNEKSYICNPTVSQSNEKLNICNSTVSHLNEKLNICNTTVSHSNEKLNICNPTVSHSNEKLNICNTTVSQSNERLSICNPIVSHSNEKPNICNTTASNEKSILITKLKSNTSKNNQKTLIITSRLNDIENEIFAENKLDCIKEKAVPYIPSLTSTPLTAINSQLNSIYNQSSNLLETQKSQNIAPSSSTAYLQNKVLFRKRKSNMDLKDSPTSLSKISRTFFALDRLYRCKSQWMNDGERCISCLRELRDLLVLERVRQQTFLDSMMQLNIERLKKKCIEKSEKKNLTPAEKLIDKLSLKIKVSEANKIPRPIIKRKTFSDIQKEQEKQKLLSRSHLDHIAENQGNDNEVAMNLKIANNSQSLGTYKRKISNDPLVFKKFKYSKLTSSTESTQTNEYFEELFKKDVSDTNDNAKDFSSEIKNECFSQNKVLHLIQKHPPQEDKSLPNQHPCLSKEIENLSENNSKEKPRLKEKENFPEKNAYVSKDYENVSGSTALNITKALPKLHIVSSEGKSLETSSKLEFSLDIRNENQLTNSKSVTTNIEEKAESLRRKDSSSVTRKENNKISSSITRITRKAGNKINSSSIKQKEGNKINSSSMKRKEGNKINSSSVTKNEDKKTNMEIIKRNEDQNLVKSINSESITINMEKNPKILHTLKIKSQEIHEKLKLVKQKTSLRTRSCRPNPKDPFISKEYGALQQAIALSLKSEQSNATDPQFKETVLLKTACKKVAKKKRSREVDQLTDAHWNESWLRGSCSPIYSNKRLGREERSLHWALSKFAEMDNKESNKQTYIQPVKKSKENTIPIEKTKKTLTIVNSFESKTCGKMEDLKINPMSDLKYPRVHLEKDLNNIKYAQTYLKKDCNNAKYASVQSKNHMNSAKDSADQLKDSNISSTRKGLRKNNDLKVLIEKQNFAFQINSAEKKVSCNVNRSTGETVLHKASRLGYSDVVEESIRGGLDVNVRDYAGWSPLHEACAYGQVAVSKILLKYGADSNSSSKNGMRPIYDALEKQDFPMIRLLLSYGADVSLLKSANCKSKVLKYLTAHQIDRDKSFNSTIKEKDEGSWKFAGTCSILDNNECVGIFEDVPVGENLLNIDFEISSRPLPLSFYLPYRNESGDVLGYRNYFILSQFLNNANFTKSAFLKHSSKDVIKMTINELADLTQKYSLSKQTDSLDLFCDKNGFIDLVYISPNRLRKFLKSKIVKIPAMIF